MTTPPVSGVNAHDHDPGFFDDVPLDELARVLGGLERRHFAAGATLLAEGDAPGGVYAIEAGLVDVFATDRNGVEHHLSRFGPGATLGEMSVFTGQPTSAAARAVTDTDVVIFSETDLRRAANAFPRLYWNLGAILSRRLARSNRRRQDDSLNHSTCLLDSGGPPLLGYALACSVAWHTQRPTLLLVVGAEPAPELQRLAEAAQPPYARDFDAAREPRAYVLRASADESKTPDVLAQTVDDLCDSFDHVLVQIPVGSPPPLLNGRTILLADAESHTQQGPGPVDHSLAGWSKLTLPLRPDRDGMVRVPPLTALDESALGRGLLPQATPAGRALGWTARRITGLSVGLALGAGGTWGYAHVGVLRVLERVGLPVDYLTGASIGAAVAALYALGYEPQRISDILDRVGTAAFRLTLPVRSLLSITGVRARLRRIAGDTRIEDLPVPLAVVAADIIAQREVVFRRGPLWAAVLASMSIPGIYPPQTMGPHLLVDGATLNPVPSNVAAEMGAGTVVAVKLVGAPTEPDTAPDARTSTRAPLAVQTLLAAIMAMQGKITADTAAAATLLIEVKFEKGGAELAKLRSFSAGRANIALGEAAAEDAVPRLQAAFPWLKPWSR